MEELSVMKPRKNNCNNSQTHVDLKGFFITSYNSCILLSTQPLSTMECYEKLPLILPPSSFSSLPPSLPPSSSSSSHSSPRPSSPPSSFHSYPPSSPSYSYSLTSSSSSISITSLCSTIMVTFKWLESTYFYKPLVVFLQWFEKVGLKYFAPKMYLCDLDV